MRILPLLCCFSPSFTHALQIPNIQSFISAFSTTLEDFLPPLLLANDTATEQQEAQRHDLLKRQYSNTCPKNFNACTNLGAPGLCCADSAVCSADAAGHVACCPTGVACSGTIGGIITAGTVNSLGSLISATGTQTGVGVGGATTTSSFVNAATTTTSNGLIAATSPTTTTQNNGQYHPSTSGGGFVIDGTSTVATPGAAVRAVQVPLVARVIIRLLEYIPL